MTKLWQGLKQNFWPISAIIFCPCHLPLTMGILASFTAGTVFGTYLTTYYNSIESTLAVAFSFYFLLAFMIWVVRGPKKTEDVACAIDQKPNGLSTQQIVVWGIIGMFTMPALVSIGFFARQDSALLDGINTALANMEYSSGFIWLVSIATVVMIPIMVIWLVWLWLAWSKADLSTADAEQWGYEYE